MADKTLKAYEVHDGDEGWSIRFATNGATARREGANELNTDFEGIEHCRRRPSLDQFAPGPVPPMALIAIGWWFECFHCGRNVSDSMHEELMDEGLDPDDFVTTVAGHRVFCSSACQQKDYVDQRARASAQAALIELAESKFPGCVIKRVHVCGTQLEPSPRNSGLLCSVDFDFPGSTGYATWAYGDTHVQVCIADVPTFRALYGEVAA